MNRLHRIICRSGYWRRKLEQDVVPWTLQDAALGENCLEIGPGPGLTTDLLRTRVPRLTAIEVDRELAWLLSQRMAGTNVTVVHQDATGMRFPDGVFTAAVCMTMLHHVPSATLQERLLAEVARVLQPGGVFVGCDRLFSSRFDITHLFDTKVPVLPEALDRQLWCAGFERIRIDRRRNDFRFIAWKRPGPDWRDAAA